MEDYPCNLVDMEKRFASDEACRAYLESLRWPSGFLCPRCGGREGWRMKTGLILCRQCRYQASVTAGTIFQGSRLPLTLWFRAIWYVTSQKNGISALGIQRILGFSSYQTAWAWLHKLRRAMVRPGRDRLSGTIQVDETMIGGERAGKRGRGAEGKTLVLVAAQEDGTRIGRIRLSVIPDASAASIEKALEQMVEPGSHIRTDGWLGYNGLEAKGYQHEIIRASAFVGDDLLPYCHRVASLLKRWFLGTHQGSADQRNLAYYLDEYTFRFNRRTSASRGKLFYRLVQQAVQVPPAPYKTLITHNE